MELLSTLQEASGHPIEDLKKIMSKDPRTKPLFSKGLELTDLRNPAEFLNSVKFFLLNNRNVISFVDDRNYTKDMSSATLKKLRELKASALTQKDIDALQEFTADLFREFSYVERNGISGPVRKELVDWKNGNGRFFDLSRSAQKELMSVPGLRPTRPTLLYRGLLFSSHDLKERKRYDGQMEVGKGLQFLRSVRDGSRIVDLEWDRASSWSTDRDTALAFARFGSANSNFGATMQWLERGARGDAIDGDLGFLISTLAQPEEILIDIERLQTAAHLKHGSESEMILAPGKYTCRVATKLTKKGEVDPIAPVADESVNNVIEAVREFARTWKIDVPPGIIDENWSSVDAERALDHGNTDLFLSLCSRTVKEELLRSYSELKAFYDDHLKSIPTETLQSLVADKTAGPIIDWIVQLRKQMTGQNAHPAFKKPDNSRGRTTNDLLTPEQFRESGYTLMSDRMKEIAQGGRFTDSMLGLVLYKLGKGFGVKIDREINRRGRKEQEEAVDQMLDGFFRVLKQERPADQTEAIKILRNALAASERNARLLNELLHRRELLDDALAR
jgi:hypothetical protein